MTPRTRTKNRDALVEKMLRFAFWMSDQHVMPSVDDVCDRFPVSRPTAYRWLAAARTIRGVHLPMKQRQITHPRGTFAACGTCKTEPRHYVASGSTQREGVQFAVIADRHQLECPCRRCTGWCASLPDAVRAWGELGETLPLPLAPRRDNVRPMRAAKGRAQR